MFPAIRAELAQRLGLTGIVDAADLAGLASETLLHYLSEDGVPVGDVIVEALGGGAPNAVHRAVGEVLTHSSSSVLWTTNVDELVEDCVPESVRTRVGIVVGYKSAPGAGRLLKPHGTLSRPSTFAFRSTDVLRRMPFGWHERLIGDLTGSSVLVLGYRGADPDIWPTLREGLALADEVLWFDVSSARQDLADRIDSAGLDGSVELRLSAVPGQAFCRALAERADGAEVPRPLFEQLATVRPPLLDFAHFGLGEHRFASARVLEHLGYVAAAYRRFGEGVRYGSACGRWQPLRYLLAMGLYRQARWSVPLRRIIYGASRCDRGARWQTLQLFTARLKERDGVSTDALGLFERVGANREGDVRLLTDIAAAARKLGHLYQARSAALGAYTEAGAGADGELISRVLFERAFAHRLCDEPADWSKCIDEYSRVYRMYGGPRWNAWAAYERGCGDVLWGSINEALAAFGEALVVFERTGDYFAASQVRLARSTAYRKVRDHDRSASELSTVRSDWAAHRRRSWFEEATLAFESGELARATSQHVAGRCARDWYHLASVAPCVVHQILGRLGAIVDDPGPGAVPLLEAIGDQATTIGFRYGNNLAATVRRSYDEAGGYSDPICFP